MEVMKQWGLTPQRWRLLSEDDKAEIMAFESVKSDMASYEDYLSESDRLKKQAEGSVKK